MTHSFFISSSVKPTLQIEPIYKIKKYPNKCSRVGYIMSYGVLDERGGSDSQSLFSNAFFPLPIMSYYLRHILERVLFVTNLYVFVDTISFDW